MATKATTAKKITIDTSYSGKQKTERFEMRCSKNFHTVVEALMEKLNEARSWNKKTKADVVMKAIKEMAMKEGLFKIGDDYHFDN